MRYFIRPPHLSPRVVPYQGLVFFTKCFFSWCYKNCKPVLNFCHSAYLHPLAYVIRFNTTRIVIRYQNSRSIESYFGALLMSVIGFTRRPNVLSYLSVINPDECLCVIRIFLNGLIQYCLVSEKGLEDLVFEPWYAKRVYVVAQTANAQISLRLRILIGALLCAHVKNGI